MKPCSVIASSMIAFSMFVPHYGFAQSSLPSRDAVSAVDRMTREIEFNEINRQLRAGADARREIEAELSKIKADRALLIQKTIDLAASVNALESRISATQERLSVRLTEEADITMKLDAQYNVIVTLLSGLQRMGQMPPLVVLADPADLLQTVRGALLLGAALPDLTEESKKLSVELDKKTFVRKAIEDEKQILQRDLVRLVDERLQLTAALEARQKDEVLTREQLSEQSAQVAELAAKSQSLKDLLGHAESELGVVVQATEAARESAALTAADAVDANTHDRKDERSKLVTEAFRDPARIAPKVAFSELKGLLKQIVAGSIIRGFNDKDQLGNPGKGLSVQTRSDAIITAPSDAWVSYAGPFRSFGQLLILNAGGGYYILLAGMDRMTVGLGQFVLAGEPVAMMAGSSGTSSGSTRPDKTAQTLYIEFRKDGTPIDPTPWWAPGSFEKVRE